MSTPSILNGDATASYLALEAAELRRSIVTALYPNGGHYGGCLSVLDILVGLYNCVLRVESTAPRHPERDRFILSKGHAALALYAVLRRFRFHDMPLEGYATVSSHLEGHPDMHTVPGVDFSTGSLGQGLSVGVGMAIALKQTGQHVWVVLGDGECQEGQVWEAAMLASYCALSNLHVVIDANGYQEFGRPANLEQASPVPVENMGAKWDAFGWDVSHCDGHDFDSLRHCFIQMTNTKNLPTVVIARTIKGKGFPLFENDPQRFHCASISESEHHQLLEWAQK